MGLSAVKGLNCFLWLIKGNTLWNEAKFNECPPGPTNVVDLLCKPPELLRQDLDLVAGEVKLLEGGDEAEGDGELPEGIVGEG